MTEGAVGDTDGVGEAPIGEEDGGKEYKYAECHMLTSVVPG